MYPSLGANPPPRRPARRAAIVLVAAGTLLTCTDDERTGPLRPVKSSFDVSELLAANQTLPIPVDSILVELRRVSDSSVAVADTFNASGGGDSLVITIQVPLSTSPETFHLYLSAFGGGITWFEVRSQVTVNSSSPTTTPPLNPAYVGPGANATAVTVSQADTTVAGGDSLLLGAVVRQGQTPVTGVPVGYFSTDTTKVPHPRQVGLNTAWVRTPAALNDSVRIVARAPNQLRDTVQVGVYARAASLERVSGDAQMIAAGQIAADSLVVRVRDATGGPYRRGFPVSFAVAGGAPPGTGVSPTSVVSDTAGLAKTALTAGTATGGIVVNATASGLSGSPVVFSASVNVAAGPAASLTVTPDTVVVQATGDTARFVAACADTLANPVACPAVTWTSLAPALASVSPTGLATALGPGGLASIEARAGALADTGAFGINGLVTVTVLPNDTVVTAIGDTVQLRALGTRLLGDTATIPNVQLVWQTLTPAVTIVDSLGQARLVGAGVGNVRATSAGVSGIGTLRVIQTPDSFDVTPDSAVIGVGGLVTLTGRSYDRRGFQIPGRTPGWVSRNPSSATVNAAGQVTGLALDSVGVYIVGNDSTFTDSARVRIVTNPPQFVQWGTDSASVGRGTTFQQAILLSQPAPAGGIPVRIISSDTLILKPQVSLVTFSSGQTNRTVTLEGRAAGSVTVTATDTTGQYTADTLIVGVLSTLEFRTIANPTFHATNFSINSAEQRAVLVFLSDPAPPGGLGVQFQESTPGIATVAPSTAVIPGGQLSVQVDLQGTGVGSTSLTPTATGFVGKSSSVTTSLAQFTISMPWPRIGAGQYMQPSVSVPNRMDRGTLVNLATLTPGVGRVPDTVTVPTNTFSRSFRYDALTPGPDTITANRSGWVEGRGAVSVNTPRVIVFGLGTLTAGGPVANWTIAVRDSTNQREFARWDSLRVTLTSRDTSVVQLDVTTGLIPVDQSRVTRQGVRPVGGGSTYLVASAAGHLSDSVLVTVLAPKLNMQLGSPGRAGTRQRSNNNFISLPFTIPTPLVVRLTHVNPAVATSVDSVIIPGNTTSGTFTIDGLAPGVDTVVATAPGYEADTVFFTVTTNRLLQTGLTSNYFITSPPDAFQMRPADAFGTIHVTIDTIIATLESTDTTVFVVDSATVTVLPGQTISSISTLSMRGVGSARVRWSALPLYPLDSTFVINVNPAPLTLNVGFPGRVGIGQYVQSSVTIPNPVSDTVFVALSHPGTPRGTAPDTVTIPPGSNFVSFNWAGTASGNDSLVATATNFVPDSATLLVTRPQLYVNNLPAAITVNDTVFLSAYPGDSLSSAFSRNVVDTVFVTFTSTDTTVLAVDSTSVYRILPNTSFTPTVRVIARGPGTAQIVVRSDTLYIPDTTNVTVVTAPAITLSPASLTLGTGQQYRFFNTFIPNGVADTTWIALTMSDTAIAQTAVDSVRILPGQTFSNSFTVFARSTIGSVRLTATADGFTEGQADVIVGTPVVGVFTTTVGYVGQGSVNFSLISLDQTGSSREVRDTLVVTLSSTNPAVLALDSTTVRIPANSSGITASWTPLAAGAARVVATAPGHAPDTSDVITVSVPQVTLNLQPTVGVAQQFSGSVSRPFNSVNPVVVTLVNGNPGALTLPDTVTIGAFSSFRSFNVVGAATGSAVVRGTATGFVDSEPDTVVVGTPVLFVNGPNSGTAGSFTNVSASARDQANNNRAVSQTITVTFMVDNAAVADFGGQSSITADITVGSSSSPSVRLDFKTTGIVTVTATTPGYTQGVRVITVN